MEKRFYSCVAVWTSPSGEVERKYDDGWVRGISREEYPLIEAESEEAAVKEFLLCESENCDFLKFDGDTIVENDGSICTVDIKEVEPRF